MKPVHDTLTTMSIWPGSSPAASIARAATSVAAAQASPR